MNNNNKKNWNEIYFKSQKKSLACDKRNHSVYNITNKIFTIDFKMLMFIGNSFKFNSNICLYIKFFPSIFYIFYTHFYIKTTRLGQGRRLSNLYDSCIENKL